MSAQQPEAGRAESARRQATRQRLLDAAFEVFGENGFHGTSIEMIAERADFTRGAFYSNFASKEELFFTMLEEGHARVFEQLEEGVEALAWPDPGPDGRLDPDVLTALLNGLLAGLPKEAAWFRIDAEFETLALRDPAIAERFIEMQHRFRDRVAQIIEQAVASIGGRLGVSAVEAAQVLTAFYGTMMREAILEGRADDFIAGRGPHVRTMALIVSALIRR